jgi:hypothetical protein
MSVFLEIWNLTNNWYQTQASDQFLAITKLATNKAICLKTKTINKSKMYFKRFLATNNKCISVIAHSTQDPPPLKLEKILFFGLKSWFFTRNTPKMFAPPSARRNFCKCAPPPPNLESRIRPWVWQYQFVAGHLILTLDHESLTVKISMLVHVIGRTTMKYIHFLC